MSTSLISTLALIVQKTSIYLGIPVLIAGLLGGFLNIIVFLSLRTFRQRSCAFYLTVLSFIDIGQLIVGLFIRIMIVGFNIDWTAKSVFFCKFRYFFVQTGGCMSSTCICLAIIDQYFATCSRPRWQQWSSLKLAHRLILLFTIIWCLHDILYLIFFNLSQSSVTGQVSCALVNTVFSRYHNYFFFIIVTTFLPAFISVLFGYMVYRNVKELSYRTVPLVRRELDKQLTTMVLVQIIVFFWSSLPYSIANILVLNIHSGSNPMVTAIIQFAGGMSNIFLYFHFSSPFYVYIGVSERFRRQLTHVLLRIYLNRCRQPTIVVNQVVPES